MAIKKILKLVNNERVNFKLVSRKACDSTSTDICPHIDYAACSSYAYDECSKEDYAGCYQGADDICTYDAEACGGAGGYDDVA